MRRLPLIVPCLPMGSCLAAQLLICRRLLLVLTTVIVLGDARLLAEVSADPLINEIAQSYERVRAELKSVLIEYDLRGQRLIPQLEYFKKFGNLDPPTSAFTEILAGNRIYTKRVLNRKPVEAVLEKLGFRDRNLSDEDLKKLVAALDAVEAPAADQETLFDGETVRTLRPHVPGTHREYMIDPVKATPYRCTGVFYLDYIGLGPKDPCITGDEKAIAYGRMPEMLRAGNFTRLPTNEAVSGANCLVVDAPGYLKFWLDPRLSYAVRRNMIRRDDALRSIAECDKFTEVLPNVWIPREVRVRQFEELESSPGNRTAVHEFLLTVYET